MNLGEKIKAKRIELGYNQKEFGCLFNPSVTKATVSRWENNRENSSPQRARQLMKILEISPSEYQNLVTATKKRRETVKVLATAKEINDLADAIETKVLEKLASHFDFKEGEAHHGQH